ncbi:MAG: hypothetical protein D6767_09890 [Candidatus Hydrogenedentota bacterium]|nr:MAG: hypothetical protein D6767_09890 [Candidatus Hydrogenedentota bacterium]
MNKKQVIHQIRDAVNLFSQGEYTCAHNLLKKLEPYASCSLLKAKIAHIRIQCLMRVGNVDQAKELVEDYLAFDPLDGRINVIAARFFREIGDLYRARRLYLRAICLNPDREEFALDYAQFLRDLNKPQEAKKVLVRILLLLRRKLEKDHHRLTLIYLQLAQLYFDMGSYTRAGAILSHLSDSCESFHFYDMLAECYLHKRMYPQAEVAITEYLRDFGYEDPQALYIYAKALAGQGRTEEALEQLRLCQASWGELVVTSSDMVHLYPLIQDGSIHSIPKTTIQIYE